MSYLVYLNAIAEEHVIAADDYWQEHHPSKPLLFQEELATALGLLSSHPEAGEAYTKKPPFRRKLLSETGYYLYYVVDPPRTLVHVVAIWSTRRGTPPLLR